MSEGEGGASGFCPDCGMMRSGTSCGSCGATLEPPPSDPQLIMAAALGRLHGLSADEAFERAYRERRVRCPICGKNFYDGMLIENWPSEYPCSECREVQRQRQQDEDAAYAEAWAEERNLCLARPDDIDDGTWAEQVAWVAAVFREVTRLEEITGKKLAYEKGGPDEHPASPDLTATLVTFPLLLTVRQAATLANVSERTIWNWVKAGKLTPAPMGGARAARFWRDDIMRLCGGMN